MHGEFYVSQKIRSALCLVLAFWSLSNNTVLYTCTSSLACRINNLLSLCNFGWGLYKVSGCRLVIQIHVRQANPGCPHNTGAKYTNKKELYTVAATTLVCKQREQCITCIFPSIPIYISGCIGYIIDSRLHRHPYIHLKSLLACS